MANWQTPKTDWITNPKPPEAVDFNRIENNTQHILEQIEAKKGAIVDAIYDKGIDADIEDTHAELGNKIRDITDSIEETIALVIPGYQDSWSQTHYIDKPETKAHLYMLVDLLENSTFRSISTCDLSTFLWNSIAHDRRGTGYAYDYVESSYAKLRRYSGVSPIFGDVNLSVQDTGTQFRLNFSGDCDDYTGNSFEIPIKIFGKME